MKNPKVAIVADWLTSRGGAEHVVLTLAQSFPGSQIFTSVYNADLFPEFHSFPVHTSFLQKLPSPLRNKHQFLLPLFPRAFQEFDLSEFDIVISSSSSGFSKCVRTRKPSQKHICYCHTPVRFLYHAREEYLKGYPLPWYAKPAHFILPRLLDSLTKIDQKAAKEVDIFLSNSDFVGERILKYYHQISATMYPGVDTQPFVEAGQKHKKQDYFLALGRFIPYKKFDLLVETFVKNKLPLKLGGVGPELKKCKEIAGDAPNIEFLGFVNRSDLPGLYAQARAFLFPAEEDFGLTPVEAMSAGTPVIYYDKGGARESVGGPECGIPFAEQTVGSLQGALDKFLSKSSFKTFDLMARGKSFDQKVLQKNIQKLIQNL